jgi:hypothetical protein
LVRRIYFALLISCFLPTAPLARGQTKAPASTASGIAAAENFSGKVVETTNVAGYTYALVDTGTAKLWAAAPQFPVKVGDSLDVADGMPMRKYHSKAMNRDFDLVAFTGNVKVNGASPVSPASAIKSTELPPNHPPVAGMESKPVVDLSGIKKAEGGKTIAEIYAAKSKLSGKQVKVRGKVVRFNGDIMGKNWIHIQDGTGAAGRNDLTVTSASKAKIGDTILVSGVVGTDRDFGGSYQYSIIVEEAKVTVQ